MSHLDFHPPGTTLVIGASRGLGRGIATAVARAGIPVVAVARTAAPLRELAASEAVRIEVADAGDPSAPGRLIDRYEPQSVILVAGARPPIRPLQHHTWDTFSVNWHADVRIAFHWLREVLLKPLAPGGLMIVISSGAALNGSPLSGGYAGAKSTQRLMTAYAQEEADRAGRGIRFITVLPRITPLTDLGRPAVRAYAAREGLTEEQYLMPFGPPLTPEMAGAGLLELVRSDHNDLAPEYLLSAAGLKPLPRHAPPPALSPPTNRSVPVQAGA
jgi:NAD(P)-dependent dehydrogenase (short-subunit alcohol dehydrogenase family)